MCQRCPHRFRPGAKNRSASAWYGTYESSNQSLRCSQIADIPVKPSEGSVLDLRSVPVVLIPGGIGKGMKVTLTRDGSSIGAIGEQDSTILGSIAEESSMEVQSIVRSDPAANSVILNSIIYGSLDAFREVGVYLAEEGRFLQDPSSCERDVPYRNPHRLTGLDEHVPTTFELIKNAGCPERPRQLIEKPIDVLEGFESREEIAEASTPKCLKSSLYR